MLPDAPGNVQTTIRIGPLWPTRPCCANGPLDLLGHVALVVHFGLHGHVVLVFVQTYGFFMRFPF